MSPMFQQFWLTRKARSIGDTHRCQSPLRVPNVWIPATTPQHAAIMTDIHRAGDFDANDIPDIHLAALAISHGLKLATHDSGFARFDGLRWFDPIGS